MYINFTNNKAMSKKSRVLASVGTAMALITTQVSADKINDNKDKLTAKKFGKVFCKTKLACEKLSLSIQAQIDELKEKGFRNLTREEKIRYGKLKKQFIALEKAETKYNDNLIAEEKQETKEKKSKNTEKLKEISSKLDTIKGSL